MAIDLSRIENLLIDEGTNENPFILKDIEVTTLYKLAISGNPKFDIRGVVNTTTGTILKYESYQIKKAYPNLTILAREVTTQDWSIQLLSNNILESASTQLIATNISVETLNWKIDDVSLSVTTGSYGEQDVKDHLHFDNLTGKLSYDAPTSNAGWAANIQLSFWPSYIEEPTAEDYRTVFLTVRAIAVTSVTYDFPSRIDESSTVTLSVAPYPTNNTKDAVGGCRYSIRTTYGTLSPSSGTITTRRDFIYYAPEFKDVPYSEDEEGKYYNHHFIIGFYMFGSTTESGTVEADILMKNTAFRVTCDRDSLVEAESAEFEVFGYNWDELQKTMVVNELDLHDITEEELRRRVEFGIGPYFIMKDPIDNATYSADVTLYIAPPGADPIGERAYQFPMHLRAQGITNLTLSPQTIGQGLGSIIQLEYKPANHTKGVVYYSFSCPNVSVTSEDNVHGIYGLFSSQVAEQGHDATTKIFSEYIGDDNPLLTTINKLYVQSLFFKITFDGDEQREISKDEGEEIQCYTDILHISELKRQIDVNILEGRDLIDEDFILNKLHFSDDISTDKIWFDEATENYSWKADITITFVAKYVPEGIEPPYSQVVLLHYEARKVTGAEWQKDEKGVWNNYPINTLPYRTFNDLRIVTLPYDNTKQKTLVKIPVGSTPFSIGTLAAGITINQGTTSVFSAMPTNYYSPESPGQWYLNGFVDALSSGAIVDENVLGRTSQDETPSTENIVYPKNLTLWKSMSESTDVCKLGDGCIDSYIIDEDTVYHQVGKLVLNDTTSINFESGGEPNEDSVCFYITISGRKQDVNGWSSVSSHFKVVDDWVLHTEDVDAMNNTSDGKTYIRISNETIGVTDYTQETTDTYRAKITRYITTQYENGTPITIWYAREEETSEEVETLYFEKPIYQTNPYHVYTANDPVNQCSIEFINNNTTATSRTIFGTPVDVTEQGNKNVEAWLTDTVRTTSTEVTQVPFFAGTRKSINQYRKVGNEYELLTRAKETAGHLLPNDYQEVEYLTGDGTHFIDTGIITTTKSGFNLDFVINESKNQALVGGRNSTTSNTLTVFMLASAGNKIRIDFNNQRTLDESLTVGMKNNLQIVNNGTSHNIILNGVSVTNTNPTSAPNLTHYMFAVHDAGGANNISNCTIFKYVMLDNGSAVRNFIPCYRKSDSKKGMYDLITNNFYTSATDNNFIAGPDVISEISGLSNNAWKFKDYPDVPETEISETIDALTIREKHVTGFRTSIEYGIKYQIDGEWVDVFTNAGGWEDDTYKTLVFTDKIQTYSDELTTFIQNNSTLMELEKGEINVWENFCGKYEEWTDEERAAITWAVEGESSQEGTPTPNKPIDVISKSYYNEDRTEKYEIRKINNTYYDGYYMGVLTRRVKELVLTGDEGLNGSASYIKSDSIDAYITPTGMVPLSTGNGIGWCTHLKLAKVSVWNTVGHPNEYCFSSNQLHINFAHDVIGTSTSTTWTQATTAIKAYLKAQYQAGTPVKIYIPISTTTQEYTPTLYDVGNIHRRYTISKILNDDDTGGDSTKTNKFNKGFVFDKEHNIPTKFFLSRFIPGWHNDDSTDVISMAKGLSSQQRTITTDKVSTNGCYYKKENGEIDKIQSVYYAPLLAYAWLSYLTYGSLNLKEAVGVGASRIGAEGQIFQDDAGTPLTVGQSYNTVFILNNGSLTQDTYQNYDFNIVGGQFIAEQPAKTMKIGSIEVGSVYTAITFANYSLFTATVADDYYSLNSCFSKTGYSEETYLDINNNPVVSGYGIHSNYNDDRHPVRCLNIENMWGGGSYVIDGTQFVGDEEDASIVHPVLWNPEDPNQLLEDNSTWETLNDTNVLLKPGTWDIGSYKYHNTRCAWPEKETLNKVPYYGFNVYDRPETLDINTSYLWLTGSSSIWVGNYTDMCGLGQTTIVDKQSIGGTSHHIPETEYVELEYIKTLASKPAYINTGLTATTAHHYRITYDIMYEPNSKRSLQGFSSGNPYWGQNTSNMYENQGANLNVPTGERDTVIYDVDYSNAGNNNVSLEIVGKRAPHLASGHGLATLQIFSMQGSYNVANQTLWYCKVELNGAVVREFIPARRLSDNTVGLYDKVNGVFYGSANSNKFEGGKPVAIESLARICGTL